MKPLLMPFSLKSAKRGYHMYMGPVDKIPPIITKTHFLMPGSLKCFVTNCGVIKRFVIAMRMNMRTKIGAILTMSLEKKMRLDEKSV